jgi:hypothetical protein
LTAPRSFQSPLGIPLIVDYAELPQIVADVVQDGVQAQFENVAVVMGAQQGAGAFDQGVDVGFLVAGRDHLAVFMRKSRPAAVSWNTRAAEAT